MLERRGRGPVRDLGPRVEHLVQPLHRGLALLAHREHPPEGVHRPGEHEDVAHEGHEAADGEPALDHVQATEQEHGRQSQVGQKVDLAPQLCTLLDAFEARRADGARLLLEAVLHQRRAPKRLDDADAGRHLLDGRRQVAGQVLQPPRYHLVLVLKDVARDRDRDHAQHDDERELPVELGHQDQHDRERHEYLQEPDQAKAHEPPDRVDVRDRA